MTRATVPSNQSVTQSDFLDRLATRTPSQEVTADLWTAVHDEVQEQLAILEAEVCRNVAGIRVATGRTRGDGFFLFTYRTFLSSDHDLDPVVVGVTFTPTHQGVTVEADVSGEQTGDLISTMPSNTVADSREELLAAARKSGQLLCQTGEAIAAALKDPTRKVE